jgi:predicted aspartyl protease
VAQAGVIMIGTLMERHSETRGHTPAAPMTKHTACRYIMPILAALGGCASDQSAGCTTAKIIEVPLQAVGQIFTVPVTVNGHDLQMILDTGNSTTTLTESGVQKWHIPQSGRTYSIGVGASGGSMRSNADVESMSIAGVAIPVSYLPVSYYGGSNVDGFLGLDILGKYDLDIDGLNRTLGLYRAHCTAEPPWSSATLVEGTSKTRWLQMPIEIDGVTSMGVVDTGTSYTTIRSPVMRQLGLTEEAIATDRALTTHVVAGKDSQARLHKFHTIRLGPVTAHDASILILPGEPPSLGGGRRMPDAIVGQDLLRNRHVWFSWSTGRLYL